MTIEEKIRIIENSSSFAELPSDILPKSYKESYYFVSYSHKDYKMVLSDILRLEELGVNIWYDNEMHIGENWREIAQLYISKFQCAGVIFYLTENSISSPACNQEVEYVLTHNKNFLSINQPLHGRQVESGYSMLNALAKEGMPCSDELLANFKQAFGDEILYLDVNESIEKKANQILSIPREDLFEITEEYTYELFDRSPCISACKDNTIITADISKIYSTYSDGTPLDKTVNMIGDCVFTNAIKLQSIKIPPTVAYIGESAFRNCTSLEEIDLSKKNAGYNEKFDKKYIGNNAFRNCTSLKHIDLSRAASIGERAFEGCTALQIKRINGSIGSNAFFRTKIEEIEYIAEHPSIKAMAFYNCTDLRSFNVTGTFVDGIGMSAFNGCKNLTYVSELKAPKQFEPGVENGVKMESSAFGYCSSLESIRLSGSWDISYSGYLFSGCDALREIDLELNPKYCTAIPYGFAKGCTNLTTVTNSEIFTHIGSDAFNECSSLEEFDLSSVKVIEECGFAYTGLKKAYLKSIEQIGRGAFSSCEFLRQVTIGKDCRSIASAAFLNCPALTTLKILSEDVSFDRCENVFQYTDQLQVVYLRSLSVYNQLVRESKLAKLAVIYIGENVNTDELYELRDFIPVESDEGGFRKFEHKAREVIVDPDEDIDPTDDEINEEDPYAPCYPNGGDFIGVYGSHAKIKHRRIDKPQIYFIEQIMPNADGGLSYAMVSMHTGKSFMLPGNLVESCEPAEDVVGKFIRIPVKEGLEGKSCCISSNGELHYCTIDSVEYVSLYGIPFPTVNQQTMSTEYAVKAIHYEEDFTNAVASGIDIDSITVFNDEFEVESVFRRPD